MTTKQFLLLDYIAAYTERQGYPPSIRDMADYFGWNSTYTASCQLASLRRQGLLSWVKHRSRSYTLTPEARRVLQETGNRRSVLAST